MKNARAVAVLIGLAALPLRGQAPATIRGRVIADDTDEPVANARVAAPGASTAEVDWELDAGPRANSARCRSPSTDPTSPA